MREGHHRDPHLKSYNWLKVSSQYCSKFLLKAWSKWSDCLGTNPAFQLILTPSLEAKKYGSKLSFYGFESHWAGVLPLPQTWGSSRPWTCPDQMPQLLVPRRMLVPDFRMPEEMLLTLSTMVLLRILQADVQRVSAWGWGAINSRWAGDHSTLQAAGAGWLTSSTFCPSLLFLR